MMKDIFPEDEYEKIKVKENTDRKLLAMEFFIALAGVIVLLGVIALAVYIPMPELLKICIISIGCVIFGVTIVLSIMIEQKAGYYECSKCGHKYVPTFAQMVFSFNMGRTRLFKCPKCGKRSWSRKVISKD